MKASAIVFKPSYQKLVIVAVGLVVRCVIAWIYYGSHDIDTFISITGHTLAHDLPGAAQWHYFPTVALYLWFSGFLVTFSSLPLAFCIKIIPIMFDVAIALLVFDVARKRLFKNAFHIGLLYALCPVPIIITAVHGQWDSLFLFFILLSFYVREFVADSVAKYIVFGALFSYAILLKPIGFWLFPFFFIAPKVFALKGVRSSYRWACYQTISLCSAVCTLSIGLIGFKIAGLSILDLCGAIFSYFNQGVQVIGLRYALPADWDVVINLLQNRLWILCFVALLARWYYQGKVHIYRIIGISLAAFLGFSGICPQYLMWLIPFFLIKNSLDWLAVYGFVVSIFYIFFYAAPTSSSHPSFQSMLSFTPLTSLLWAALPAWITSWHIHDLTTILGNVIIPCICLAFLMTEIVKLRKGLRAVRRYDVKAVTEQPFNMYVLGNVYFIIVLLSMISLFHSFDIASLYRSAVEHKKAWYAIAYDGNVRRVVLSGSPYCNLVVVFIVLSVLWFMYAWRIARQKNSL